MIIICHAQSQTRQYKKQSSSTLVSQIPYGGLWCSSRDVPAPDNKSLGWCCCNPRPTVIDPDYNMIKQRCIKRIYDKIRSKSPPNRATSPTCLHCDVTHPSLTTGVVASRWGIILRSTVRTSDISWFSLPLLLQKGRTETGRIRHGKCWSRLFCIFSIFQIDDGSKVPTE